MPPTLLSIVTPAFNEAENLPLLCAALGKALGGADVEWEWVVVDDHSSDATPDVLAKLAEADPRVRAVRLSKNFGSHTAILCGLDHADGQCAVVMAADLQDPPEVIPRLLEAWRQGADVVWAVRQQREGEKPHAVRVGRAYHRMMGRMADLQSIPPEGADFFLLDRRVVDALGAFREKHVSLMALVAWMGFRQTALPYVKQARRFGRSGWTLRKKIQLVVDSVTAFTFLPIRLMSYFGFGVAVLGFLYAAVVVLNAVAGEPVQGWSSLMVVVLVVGGVQMIMLGVLGEYLWRALDETRGRPRYLVERWIGACGARPGEARGADPAAPRVLPGGRAG
jgi:dolichol-phosphate mannosyltransferase